MHQGHSPRSYEILLCDSVSFLRNTFLMQSIRALGMVMFQVMGAKSRWLRAFFFWMLHSDPCTPVKRLWRSLLTREFHPKPMRLETHYGAEFYRYFTVMAVITVSLLPNF